MEWIRHLLANIRIGPSSRPDDRRDFKAVTDELWELVAEFKARAEEFERIANYYRMAFEECQRSRAALLSRVHQQGDAS